MIRLWIIVILFLIPFHSFSQELQRKAPEKQNERNELLEKLLGEKLDENLDEIVITGTRIEQSTRELTKAHTVIEREFIEQSTFQSLEDLLNTQAGIETRRNGGLGRNTSLYIRGNKPQRTLVLIDGVAINDQQNFGPNRLQDIPLESIERIEILRGNQSSLYGEQATGGVIQIVTRKPKREESRILAHGTYGSHRMHDLGGGFMSQFSGHSIFVYSRYVNTNGYIVPRDGHTLKSILFSGTFQTTPVSKLKIFGQYHDSMVQLYQDGGKAYDKDYRQNDDQILLGFRYQHLFFGWYEPILLLNYNHFGMHASNTFGDETPTQSKIEQVTVTTQNRFYIAEGRNILTVGLEYQHSERFTQASSFGQSRNNKAVFFSNVFRFVPRLYIDSSARIDFWNSSYNWKKTLYHAGGGISYHFIEEPLQSFSFFKIRSNTSFGQTSPTLNENDFAEPGSLQTEETISVDMGADLFFLRDRLRLYASYFWNRVNNTIAFDSNQKTAKFQFGQYINGGNFDVHGVELELTSFLPFGLTLRGSYTFSDLKVRSQTVSLGLTRRAMHKGFLNLNWNMAKIFQEEKYRRWTRIHLNVHWTYMGKRPDSDFTQFPTKNVELPAYHLLNLGISYTLFDSLTFFGKVQNLLNKEYEDPATFRQDKRNWLIGTKWSQKL